MRTFALIFLYFAITFAIFLKTDAAEGRERKLRAVSLYDAGQLDQSVAELVKIAESPNDAVISWLCIALIEYDRIKPKPANLALERATAMDIDNKYRQYTNIVKLILDKKAFDLDSLSVEQYKSTSDPLNKFFLWQLLWSKLNGGGSLPLSRKEFLYDVIKSNILNSYRHAKLLSAEANILFVRAEKNGIAKAFLASLKLLEELKLTDTWIYNDNIYCLFRYFKWSESSAFRDNLLKYEKGTFSRIIIKSSRPYTIINQVFFPVTTIFEMPFFISKKL